MKAMGLKDKLVQTAGRKLRDSDLLDGWLQRLDSTSDQEVIEFMRRLSGYAGKFALISPRAAYYQDKLSWMADLMSKEDNPALQIMRRILGFNPKARNKFLKNLVLQGIILGSIERERIAKERGFDPPIFVVVSPSMKCNLRCSGCYAGKYGGGPVLPFETLDNICIQMKEMGCGFITISGGEPYMYFDREAGKNIWDLFERHPDIYFQTYTNGTMLGEQAVEKLLKLGNVAPAISVEGFEKETVARRGGETWGQILRAMHLLRQARLPFGFSVTATSANADIVATEGFIDFWIDQGCGFGWTFLNIPIGCGNIDQMVTAKQRDRLRRFTTIDIRKKKPIFWFDFWNDGCLVHGCIAGGRHCHILNDGRITACVFSPFAASGCNVKDKLIIDILADRYFEKVRHFQAERQCNLLLPCMIIDRPSHLSMAVEQGGAEPAYPGAEQLITPEMTQLLDNRAEDYRKIADEVWQSSQYDWARK